MSTDLPDHASEATNLAFSASQRKASRFPRVVVRQHRRVRNLIFDYALGTSLLGLIPIPRIFTLKLLLAGGVMLRMIWHIGKLWRFRKGQDFLAFAGAFFGSLGAFAMAATAWLTVFGLGMLFSYIKGLAFAAALFTLCWSLGQTFSQFYASGEET